MNRISFLLIVLFFSLSASGQSSMRRCTLLPITDSVEGAIGFKVFEEIEAELKRSNWCTYVSNSSMISVFSRYRQNLAQHLKTKEVLQTVAEKLKVGSLIRVSIVSEIKGVEVSMQVYGENGEDIYFSEKTLLNSDDVDLIASAVKTWLDTYSKMIPYDAKVSGVLGDQLTLDVGKGYPIQMGQGFIVKRLMHKKKHPLLKKVVDWDSDTLAEGVVLNLSDNQALGLVKNYRTEKKIQPGDWIRLQEKKDESVMRRDDALEEKKDLSPGTLGFLSIALFGSASSVDASTTTGFNRWTGNLFGVDFRAEGWITRQYFAAVEVMRSLGSLKKDRGASGRNQLDAQNAMVKVTGGYKYLPIGFFFGPQIDLYGGYARNTFSLDYEPGAGLGQGDNVISGILLGVAANIPLNREYRLFTQADFIPFPSFTSSDAIYGGTDSVTSMEFELGVKYQYSVRMTLDASFEVRSSRAKFGSDVKEITYKDNMLKLGASFGF